MSYSPTSNDYIHRNNIFVYVNSWESDKWESLPNLVTAALPHMNVIFISVVGYDAYDGLERTLRSGYMLTPIEAKNHNSGNTLRLWVIPAGSPTQESKDDFKGHPFGRADGCGTIRVCGCCGSTVVNMSNATDSQRLMNVITSPRKDRNWSLMRTGTLVCANTSGSAFIITDKEMRVPSESEELWTELTDTLKVCISEGMSNSPDILLKLQFMKIE